MHVILFADFFAWALTDVTAQSLRHVEESDAVLVSSPSNATVRFANPQVLMVGSFLGRSLAPP